MAQMEPQRLMMTAMKKNRLFLWVGFVACILVPGSAEAQMLSRLKVQPFAEELEVSYTLKADRPLTVQLYYSEDDGFNWIGPLKSVSGDVGERISEGKNKIVWNFAEEVKELYGDRFRFKVRTSEHYAFGAKFRQEAFHSLSRNVQEDLGGDADLSAFRLRQIRGWNSMEMKAPSGNYMFEMHHELDGKGVDSNVEITGSRSRPAFLGMVFNAVLPGSGIPYVTYGEAKKWTLDEHGRKNKYGNGNFWGMVVFGGAAMLLHNMEQNAYNEEIDRPFGSVETAEAAAQPFQYGKYTAGGLAGLIYTLQLTRTFKWSRIHKSDMEKFVAQH